MRELWRRAKCFVLGHNYVPDNTGWHMCYGCGRQYKERPSPFFHDFECTHDPCRCDGKSQGSGTKGTD